MLKATLRAARRVVNSIWQLKNRGMELSQSLGAQPEPPEPKSSKYSELHSTVSTLYVAVTASIIVHCV